MKNVWRAVAGAMLFVLSALPAIAAQGTGCIPVTGTYTGVAYTGLLNSAFAALISSNSGINPPVTDCGGLEVQGQIWFDTSSSTPRFRIYDGGTNLPIGAIDKSNHIWMPQIGGGIATLNAAATTDLCSLPQNYLSVSLPSGPTTITSFGASCAVGQYKILSFVAGVTLQYSTSAILLPTAASITTVASDQVTLLYTGGGVWVAVAYQRGDGTALTAPVVPAVHYAGETRSFRMTSCPAGALLEDGSAISRTTYPALYVALGTTWGAGDGSTTFNLPDSRGYVDRGWGAGESVDSGRVFGSTQLDQIQTFTGSVPTTGVASDIQLGSGYGGAYATSANVTFAGARFGSETRAKNITAYHCIFTGNSP